MKKMNIKKKYLTCNFSPLCNDQVMQFDSLYFCFTYTSAFCYTCEHGQAANFHWQMGS